MMQLACLPHFVSLELRLKKETQRDRIRSQHQLRNKGTALNLDSAGSAMAVAEIVFKNYFFTDEFKYFPIQQGFLK